MYCTDRLLNQFGSAVGPLASMDALCAQQEVKYLSGIQAAWLLLDRERLAACG